MKTAPGVHSLETLALAAVAAVAWEGSTVRDAAYRDSLKAILQWIAEDMQGLHRPVRDLRLLIGKAKEAGAWPDQVAEPVSEYVRERNRSPRTPVIFEVDGAEAVVLNESRVPIGTVSDVGSGRVQVSMHGGGEQVRSLTFFDTDRPWPECLADAVPAEMRWRVVEGA